MPLSYKPTQFLPEDLAIRDTRYAIRRQINSADGSIVAYASLGSKLQKLE